VGKGAGAIATNTAVGLNTLAQNTTGLQNTVLGNGVLFANTSGAANTGVGYFSLVNNISGSNNTALGQLALRFNSTGNNNTAVGDSALTANTTAVATLGTVTGGSGYTNGTYTGVVMTLSSGSLALTYPTATIVVAGGVVTTVTLTAFG